MPCKLEPVNLVSTHLNVTLVYQRIRIGASLALFKLNSRTADRTLMLVNAIGTIFMARYVERTLDTAEFTLVNRRLCELIEFLRFTFFLFDFEQNLILVKEKVDNK